MKRSSLDDRSKTQTSAADMSDILWEYDGLHDAYQGECEEILLEMKQIFYEDLRLEPTGTEPEIYIETWEDKDDEYLARAVFEHMQLNDEQVNLEILQARLAEAHTEHLDRGCRLKPKFCMERRFGLTALYISCEVCKIFEIVRDLRALDLDADLINDRLEWRRKIRVLEGA